MRRALVIAGKDILTWLRDISAMGILLGMPIVLILILGSALGGAGQESQIPVVVVNLDEGAVTADPSNPTSSAGRRFALGDEIVGFLTDGEQLGELFEVTESEDEDAARSSVANGEYTAALVVPADFSRLVSAGDPATLVVLKDPGAQLSGDIWQGVIGSFAARYSAVSVAIQTAYAAAGEYNPALLASPEQSGGMEGQVLAAVAESSLESVRVEDEEADVSVQMTPLDFYGVSMTAMFLMFGAMFGAFSTIRERREQTLQRILATPTSALAVTGGKMLGIFVLGMAQFTVLYVFTRFVFGVEWGGDVAAVFVVAAAEVLAVTGLAMLIASVTTTERGAGGLGPLVIQIQALMGGAFFAITVLPEWLQPMRYTSIVGWAIEGWQEVQLRGGGVGDVLGPVGAMVGFAVVLFALGSWRMGARR